MAGLGSHRRTTGAAGAAGRDRGRVLLAALHEAGLATLTHTPGPMGFRTDVCGRPAEERAYVVVPVGCPAAGTRVPDIERKPLDDVLIEL